jgi:hypothetical protein
MHARFVEVDLFNQFFFVSVQRMDVERQQIARRQHSPHKMLRGQCAAANAD